MFNDTKRIIILIIRALQDLHWSSLVDSIFRFLCCFLCTSFYVFYYLCLLIIGFFKLYLYNLRHADV